MAIKLDDTKYPSFKCSLAVSKAGTVLKLKSENYVTIAGAGDRAFGIAVKTTEDPFHEGTYLKDQNVPVAFAGIAEVPLIDTNATISVGDYVGTAAGGQVDKYSPPAGSVVMSTILGELEEIVGTALEAKASSVGGTIKVLLHTRH